MNDRKYFLTYADMEWLPDNTAYSPQYDDIYWSRGEHAGLEEKQHVFIEANRLKQRWAKLTAGDTFTIVETGFGFGMNLGLCVRLWRALKTCHHATLHYVAFEKNPVNPADLVRLQTLMDKDILQPLIEKYPLPIPGEHPLWLDDNICLTLIFGDINDTIHRLSAAADACFLDGFSPSKNEGMWSGTVMRELERLMRPGATLSSYSVAGSVKRGLKETGLRLSKLPGYGSKSEMLLATKSGTWSPANNSPKKVGIVGAGIAGLFCAMALKRRGIRCEVYETSANPLGAVAGMRQLAVYPQLSTTPQISSLFSLRSFEYARAFYLQEKYYEQSGRLQLLTDSYDQVKARRLAGLCPESMLTYLSAEQATQRAGLPITQDALYLPRAGWIDPLQILPASNFSIESNCPISNISSRGVNWVLHGGNRNQPESEVGTFSHVILATGAATQQYLRPLNLTPVRGQSLKLTAAQVTPRTLISGRVTWFPEYAGCSTVSGTYSRDDSNLDVRPQDTEELTRALNQFANVDATQCDVTVGIRTTSRDRLPVVGEIPDWTRLAEHCQLPERRRQKEMFKGYHKGLYCAVALGSHGASHAPFCAEYLARLINDEPVSLLPELSPARFAFRDAGIKRSR